MRLDGIDTPKIKGKSVAERKLAKQAREVLDQGFGKIKHIVVGKGEITSVILPKGIETFESCDHIMLKLEALPKSVYLHCSHFTISTKLQA